MQVTLGALLLVALTFFAALSTSAAHLGTHPPPALAIVLLTALSMPFGAFLWWLTLGKMWLVRGSWVQGGDSKGGVCSISLRSA